MDLMDLMVRIGADTSGAEKGIQDTQAKTHSLAGSLRKGLGTAAKVGGAAIAAAAAAAGALVKKAVDGYAQYEQLVGGVETLFGNGGKSMEEFAKGMYKTGQKGEDIKKLQQELIAAGYDIGKSGADGIYGPKTQAAFEAYAKAGGKMVKEAYENSDKAAQMVQNNADTAYKRAGLSANEYMETVTGFSASLIKSVGGDTEKAAKLADMAVVDMSDNANKMGTSMESIQNAYQGFAKGNYTINLMSAA